MERKLSLSKVYVDETPTTVGTILTLSLLQRTNFSWLISTTGYVSPDHTVTCLIRQYASYKASQGNAWSTVNILTTLFLRGLEADCVRVVKEAVSKLGGLDVIISNAVRYTISNYMPKLTPWRVTPDLRTSRI
jgi:hypothetical protein